MRVHGITLVLFTLMFHSSLSGIAHDSRTSFSLQFTPKQINRHTTKSMTLRCERNSSVQIEMVQVFRIRIVKKSESGWNLIAEQRGTETLPRGNGNVTASANIRGDIINTFLQASWDNIGNDSFGIYKCDVMGYDDRYNIVIKNTPEVYVRESKIPREHLAVLWKNTQKLLVALQDAMGTGMYTIKSTLTAVEDKVAVLENKTSALENTIVALESKQGLFEKRFVDIERLLGGFMRWPEGFYALLKPKTGCPFDNATLNGTDYFQTIHTESHRSSDPSDSHSSVFAPDTLKTVNSKRFVTMKFCEIVREVNTSPWPLGSFCINKIVQRSCPPGFVDGFVQFDVEDLDREIDGRNDVVSDGDTHVKLFFCCQSSGSASTPIKLPPSRPFMLYRKGGQCQRVQEMSVSAEYLQFNTEDYNNVDELSGSHPDVDQPGTVLKFHMCYYTPI
ncbi:apextrin [Elysia marginata]|uniref:Apextrin n=1 Tax=Elysia marginata TaxID=1093978 RepID=A0AAV4GLL8_9GAST|nr:apextrin [Elysia marginata]